MINEEKGITEHLDDLRKVLFRSLIGLGIGLIAGFGLANHLIAILKPARLPLIAFSPPDAFIIFIKAAVAIAAVLASPWIFYQASLFAAPTLTAPEKKIAVILSLCGGLLFVLGALFAYFAALPAALSFFAGYAKSMGLQVSWSASEYFGFIFAFLLSFGIVFEMPIAIVALTSFGIISPSAIARYRRHAIVAIFILAGVISPGPDIASQLTMAIPMLILFEISIVLSRFIAKPRQNLEETSS